MSAGPFALLPCPFCGGAAHLQNGVTVAPNGDPYTAAWCIECGAMSRDDKDDQSATAAWNRRALSGAEDAPNPAVERPAQQVSEKTDIVELRAVLDGIENEGDLYTAAGDIVMWDDCMPEIRAALDELERLRAVERPADPRGWREAIEAAAKLVEDVASAAAKEHTRIKSDNMAGWGRYFAHAIRALSPAPKDREGG